MSRTRPPLRAEALEDRLAPALGLDPSFGTGGKLTAPPGSIHRVSEVALLPDGKFLVAGDTEQLDYAATRLNPDGSSDAAFGNGGTAVVSPTSASDFVFALATHADGRIVLAGSAYLGLGGPNQIVGAVTRLTADGQPDPTFGGVAFIPGGPQSFATAVAVQADGGIVVGSFVSDANPVGSVAQVTRLTAGGQFDPTFGSGGVASVPGAVGSVQAITTLADGALVVVVGTDTGVVAPGSDFTVARLTADGQLDPGFGGSGVLRVDFGGAETGTAVAIQSDGKIVVGGVTGSALNVARLNPDGSLDDTFATGGKATIDLGGTAALSSIAIRSDGGIFLGGSVGEDGAADFAVVALTPDGLVDGSFGNGGRFVLDFGGDDSIRTVSPLPDGGLMLLGGSGDHWPEPIAFAAARLIEDPPPAIPPTPPPVLVGGRADGTAVVLTAPDGTYRPTGTADFFPGVPIGIRTATADVNGDGTPDLIGGAGPGAQSGVMVLDGRTGAYLTSPLAFEPSFTGGVFVAGADLDGDGRAEIIATPDQGGGPNVVIYSLNPDGTVTPPKVFFALGNPAFRGGARVAVGDVNGDGTPDVIVGAGFLGGPNVEIHDGRAVMAGDYDTLIGPGFFAFDGPDAQTLRNGVFLASGDVDGDGFDDVIAGGGPGGGPRVLILGGRLLAAGDVAGAYADPVANFFAGGDADRGGVHVAAADTDRDGRADLIVGSGEGRASAVQVYLGAALASGAEPAAAQDLDPLGLTPPGGVFVG